MTFRQLLGAVLSRYFASRTLFWGSERAVRGRAEPKYLPRRWASSTIRASFLRKNQDPMKTFSAKPETVQREWYVVDATDKILGRLASEVASRLRGKHKAEYTPHVDTGDHIVIVNAEKIRVTGNKAEAKRYYRHSGYPGGIKEVVLGDLLQKHPTRVIENAVKGMLPKNPLGRAMFSKLRVYAGPEHQHQAQQPKALEI